MSDAPLVQIFENSLVAEREEGFNESITINNFGLIVFGNDGIHRLRLLNNPMASDTSSRRQVNGNGIVSIYAMNYFIAVKYRYLDQQYH